VVKQYAACQVAHAISTHKVDHSEDFYTAVDDLKPDDNSGADMLGTVEFNSACYYRYAVIDLEKLRKNLLGDDELLIKGVEAFLHSSIYALPSGKQNSFAAHQLPNFIGFTVRKNASPRSLANAFEKPVRMSNEGWSSPSAESLGKEWNELETVFAQAGETNLINRTEAKLEGVLENKEVKSVEELISKTLAHVKAALEN
jgi:CRISPR system Cascade subunit CasC